MKRTLKITKEGRAWCWSIREGRKVIFGGYCRTKKEALNDSGIYMNVQTPAVSCG